VVENPHEVLGVAGDADDEAIRRRYLELVREYPPEQHPERFAQVRAAFEALRDLDTRLQKRLFQGPRAVTLDTVIKELECRNPRPRTSLQKMLQIVQAKY
jgi:curved DNA-binding protein CbpA